MNENCWEFKKCGREANGSKVKELGICPVASYEKFDKTNNGKNGGRYCWKIPHTLCGNKVQGGWGAKLMSCATCEFYQKVKMEEGLKFKI